MIKHNMLEAELSLLRDCPKKYSERDIFVGVIYTYAPLSYTQPCWCYLGIQSYFSSNLPEINKSR